LVTCCGKGWVWLTGCTAGGCATTVMARSLESAGGTPAGAGPPPADGAPPAGEAPGVEPPGLGLVRAPPGDGDPGALGVPDAAGLPEEVSLALLPGLMLLNIDPPVSVASTEDRLVPPEAEAGGGRLTTGEGALNVIRLAATGAT